MVDELKQIRLSIANVHERINGINSNLDTFANMTHNESLDYISENSGSILDVAELSDENSSAIEEVAELFAKVEFIALTIPSTE